jgi:peptide/nickel transport system permease protein
VYRMTLASYVLQRAFAAAVLIGLISCACFLMLDFVPGSFFDEMRIDPQVSPQTVAALRAAHGLSRPGLVRFASWVGAALHGDFGISFASNRPVLELLLPRAENTLLLTIPSLLLAWTIGLVFGIWSASSPGSWLDRGANVVSTAFLTLPEIVLCSLALLAAARTGFLPVGGMVSPIEAKPGIWDLLRHMTLPVLVLTALAIPTIFRHSRAAVLDSAQLPFVKSAKAHGLSRRTLLWRHILPVAANALLSLGGISIGSLLSASLVTEVLFAWPGIGPLFLDAITARDPYLIIVIVLSAAVLLVGGNLLADLALHYRDPRLLTA